MLCSVLSDDHRLVAETARGFAARYLRPGANAREEAETIEPAVRGGLAELGFLGMTVSERWDGAGADYRAYALALEEVAAGDGAVSTMMSVHNAPTCLILERFGSDDQCDRLLRPLARGDQIGAFALTEPQAGSDASALTTKAERRGDRYILNGAKQFVTSGRIAGLALVFASTEPGAGKKGLSCFAVPTETPGYHVTRLEAKLGQRASDTAAVSLEALEVPVENRIGAEGEGYKIALSSLEAGRIGIAAQCVGMARAALDLAITYAGERHSFGKAIIDHQAVGFRLVDAKTRLEAARQMVMYAAGRRDAGASALEAACMAKLFASEAAEFVTSAALQTLGGYGYLKDFAVERIYRDVRVCQLYEGTSDIQKIILSRLLA